MVEWSRRRRGMYDITKTRMLLTTAVFAAVAALSASGANARIPADTSSASAVQESLRTGRYAAQPPSWRGKGGKGEETVGVTNPLQQTGVARSGSTYTFPECSLGLCHFDELLPARLGLATRAASAPTSKFAAGYRGLP
jgi:hypothetical protein